MTSAESTLAAPPAGPQSGLVIVPENTKGWSYRRLFADHLRGATSVEVRDPYVRAFHQVRNLLEFLQLVYELTAEGDETAVHLVTQSDAESAEKQADMLDQIAKGFAGSRVAFTWALDANPHFHARSIVTDTGWRITLDRGLELFQRFEGGPFAVENRIQETRLTRGSEIGFHRV